MVYNVSIKFELNRMQHLHANDSINFSLKKVIHQCKYLYTCKRTVSPPFMKNYAFHATVTQNMIANWS